VGIFGQFLDGGEDDFEDGFEEFEEDFYGGFDEDGYRPISDAGNGAAVCKICGDDADDYGGPVGPGGYTCVMCNDWEMSRGAPSADAIDSVSQGVLRFFTNDDEERFPYRCDLCEILVLGAEGEEDRLMGCCFDCFVSESPEDAVSLHNELYGVGEDEDDEEGARWSRCASCEGPGPLEWTGDELLCADCFDRQEEADFDAGGDGNLSADSEAMISFDSSRCRCGEEADSVSDIYGPICFQCVGFAQALGDTDDGDGGDFASLSAAFGLTDFDECMRCGSDTVMVAGFNHDGGFTRGSGSSGGGLCADCVQDIPALWADGDITPGSW